MSHSAYPTAIDLQQRLQSQGLITVGVLNANESLIPFQDYINAAIDEWQIKTNWQPWLASGSVTRTFNPPGPPVRNSGWWRALGGGTVLELDNGLITCSQITVWNTIANLPYTMTVNLDYFLQGPDSPNQNYPYTSIKFQWAQFGYPCSIKITGTWGRETTLSDEVWNIIIDRARCKYLQGMVSNPNPKSIKLGQDEFDFSVRDYEKMIEGLEKFFTAKILNYKRMGVGV